DHALIEANSMMISQQMTKKLFGNESTLNKMIYISQNGPSRDFKVTNVFRQPDKSHIEANFFVSMTSDG
ncbi:MAG TPA: hypothetical protein P5280_05500, partial [Cyclobacteriaceae bacterium]|nr:hypothetical protein [Cyclobacteriaceae bacterium]